MNPLIVPIIIVAARSGGHIIPALALAREHDQTRPIYAITSESRLDAALVSNDNHVICHETIPFSAAPVYWYHYPWALITFFWSFIRCICIFWRIAPPLIINTGGAIGLPAACAARILGIPFALYELNATPGKGSRYIARIARSVYTVFPEAQEHFSGVLPQIIPYPLRYTQKDKELRARAKEKLNIDPTVPVIIVLGGSQGAERLNYVASRAVNAFDRSCLILHQAGKNADQYSAYYRDQNKNARVHHFVDTATLALWYSAADCAIARAGSGTMHELIFFAVPTLLVPLTGVAGEHQVDNAYAAARRYPHLFTYTAETVCEILAGITRIVS